MTGDPRSGRPFTARRAAVASPHQLASSSGLWALARGGSAVDAMVAVNATLGVVFPHMTGPGGDAFWLIHHAASGATEVLNASGRAAARATPERYRAFGPAIEPRGPAAALTVPGAVDGWIQAHRRYGKLSLQECLEPAIGYARDGFPVSRHLAAYSASFLPLLRAHDRTAACFLKADRSPYAEGETMANPRLAATLEAVAHGGREAFYEGPIARAVTGYLATHGGVLSAEDFAAHKSDWVTPVQVAYRGRTVVTTPPNSQGLAHLQMLGMLEHFNVAATAGDAAAYIHLLVGATRLAFEDRDRYLTDPAFGEIPTTRLLDDRYLAERAALLGQHSRGLPSRPALAGDTTFACAVDAAGNAAAVIQSLYFEWGSGVVAGDTGLLLQNRGSSFSLDPAHPNRLQPRKRTLHTLMASMLLGPGGKPELIYGTMGGEGQPQTQTAMVTRMVDHGLGVQEAVDAPRWLYGRTWGAAHQGLRLEARFGEQVAQALTQRGHANVELVDPWSDTMGHAQAIKVFPHRLEAAADPRSDGTAAGM
jgi:gamma-glutamyltranspeptidase